MDRDETDQKAGGKREWTLEAASTNKFMFVRLRVATNGKSALVFIHVDRPGAVVADILKTYIPHEKAVVYDTFFVPVPEVARPT